MATEKTDKAETKGTSADVKNPSGASKEQLEKGERVGKPLSPEVDKTFNVTPFTDPMTGEEVETKRTVHDDSGYVT